MCAPPPLYRPRNKYEAKIFPNLGYAKIIKSPYKKYIGQCGVIVHKDPEAVRIVFSHFWDRPDGMSAEEAQDSTWCFPGEYEEYNPTQRP